MYIVTTALRKIAALKKRIRAIQGGTSASKTISIDSILIHTAQTSTRPRIISIVSESMPHLRRGAMRDFLRIMQEHRYFQESRWDKTNSIYTFPGGTIIEFFSVDQPDKVKGGRRDILFVNEANNISFETFEQLEVRTSEHIFLDWNPSEEFWFYTEVLGKRDDVDHIIVTFEDNEGLPDSIRNAILQRRGNRNWFRVYGLGLLGELEGRIYTGWEIIDAVPEDARLEKYGLDFGYTTLPLSLPFTTMPRDTF
jgi:phage terminase large subunit